MIELVCQVCDKKFQAVRRGIKMCSESCRKKRHYVMSEAIRIKRKKEGKTQYVKKVPVAKECVICTTVFFSTNNKKETCSYECSKENEYLAIRASRGYRGQQVKGGKIDPMFTNPRGSKGRKKLGLESTRFSDYTDFNALGC